MPYFKEHLKNNIRISAQQFMIYVGIPSGSVLLIVLILLMLYRTYDKLKVEINNWEILEIGIYEPIEQHS